MNIEIFSSLAGLSSAVIIITAYFKKKYNTNGTVTIIISVFTGQLLSLIGWLLNLGIFIDLDWFYIVIYGISATLMANGLSTWGVISDLLTILKLKVPKQ
ncbi:MAG: hypothetical protein QXD05_01430 [Candidatus Pacearchaeota archaeon]